MDAGDAITVRRLKLAFPAAQDFLLLPGEPEESAIVVALSLLLPYLEPYLIQTMRKARPHVTEPKLGAELDLFNAQEGQHYAQHAAFNQSLRLHGFPQREKLEASLRETYARHASERSLRWNLAYAEGFEAMTTALARYSFETGLPGKLIPAVRDLFAWHLVEELEHRAVAFEVYEAVRGGYLFRLAVGVRAQLELAWFLFRAAHGMVRGDREVLARHGGNLGSLWRTGKLYARLFRRFLPKLVGTWMPGYTPRRLEMPPRARELAAQYAQASSASSTGIA